MKKLKSSKRVVSAVLCSAMLFTPTLTASESSIDRSRLTSPTPTVTTKPKIQTIL